MMTIPCHGTRMAFFPKVQVAELLRLLLVVFFMSTSSCLAFSNPSSLSKTLTRRSTAVDQFISPLVVMWSSLEEDDTELTEDARRQRQPQSQNAWIQNILKINHLFWDYTVNFLYVSISCLILLNVCGYGYSFSAQDGFQVMPLNEFIQDRQWKQEVYRQSSLKTTPPALRTLQQSQDQSSSMIGSALPALTTTTTATAAVPSTTEAAQRPAITFFFSLKSSTVEFVRIDQ